MMGWRGWLGVLFVLASVAAVFTGPVTGHFQITNIAAAVAGMALIAWDWRIRSRR